MKKAAFAVLSFFFVLIYSEAFGDSIQIIQTGSIQLTNGVWTGTGTTPNSFVGESYFQFYSNPSGSLDFTTGRIRTSNNQNWGVQHFVIFLSNISFNPKTDTLKASFDALEWGYCSLSAPECIIQFTVRGTFTEHISFSSGTMGPNFLSSPSPFLTPEPGTFGLMGTGLFVVFGALRRKRSSGSGA